MKKILTLLILITLMIPLLGCYFDSSGVKLELKKKFYLTPTTTIEATIPLNLSQLDSGIQKDTIPENGKFSIEIEIENRDLTDYTNPKIYFTKTSNTIEYAYLYSPSGKPFNKIGDNLYNFGSTFISKQTNKMLLVGKVGPIGDDIVETHFTLGVYDENNQPLNQLESYTMRVCREKYCS